MHRNLVLCIDFCVLRLWVTVFMRPLVGILHELHCVRVKLTAVNEAQFIQLLIFCSVKYLKLKSSLTILSSKLQAS